jgi:hypothetical protein
MAWSLALSSCVQHESPTTPQARVEALAKDAATLAATQQLVNGYVVRFDGRTDANGQTTYTYTVSGTGSAPELTHFAVEIPPCAPELVGADPNGTEIGNDPFTGLDGIKWTQSLGSDDSRTYSLTYAGDVPDGLVRVGIKAGDSSALGVLPGPCQGFWITGTVFVDPDSSGSLDLVDETGIIANVTVILEGGLHGTLKTATDASGQYAFQVLDGTYTVRIDTATPEVDFNEELAASFSPTNSSNRSVTVGPDAPNIDFGYKPNAKKIISDLELGLLFSTGEDRKFWTQVLRNVNRGSTYGGYDATAVLSFLQTIEAAFFPEPYRFSEGQELAEALKILTTNPKSPVEELYRELFVTELNDAAGLGLVDDPELQDVLISWGESLLVDRLAPAALKGPAGPSISAQPSLDPDVDDALTVFNNLNQRGGGDIPD